MAIHDTDCSCPQKRRVLTRRMVQARRHRDPRWKQMLKEHAYAPSAECAVCHRHHGQPVLDKDGNEQETKGGKLKKVTLTINHLDRLLYLDDDAYLTWNPTKMRVECTICNLLFEKGMKPCPSCLKKGRYKPIKWFDEECMGCFFEKHPEVKERIDAKHLADELTIRDYNAGRAQKRRDANNKHPCFYRTTTGRCRPQSCQCTFSPTKAKNCTRMKRKKGR